MYLIDSNIFIEAKNRYYAFDLVPSFWNFFDDAFAGDEVRSINMVYDELVNGNDELADWVKKRHDPAIFLDVSDEETQKVYRTIVNELKSSIFYKSSGVASFLSGADPWLVAKAKVINATVVTHEIDEPKCQKRVPLGTVCRTYGVPFTDTFGFLRKHKLFRPF